MYSVERTKPSPFKSLYAGVLVAMAGILTLSFLAYNAISNRIQNREFTPLFNRFDELQLENARAMFESGDLTGLRKYLSHLDQVFSGSHYLLDSIGGDVLTGQSKAALLPPPPAVTERIRKRGHWVIAHRSPDGRYWFAAEGQSAETPIWTFLPFYLLVIATTSVLGWIASVGVVSPIRRIAAVISQFGQGSLEVRVHTKRPDEIGQLGRSFNQMADRLERLIVSERRLLSDISHELRSPLARLKFAIKLARSTGNSKAAMDRIERDVDRITSLVADIVEITSFEGEPAARETEIVNAAPVVDEVVRDCSLEAEVRGCTIAVQGELKAPVMGNRELLRRALENVVRNGIRYAPEHTTIQLSIQESDHQATIAVRDFGPGVPTGSLARIFDPFFRVEDARDTNGGGSGLGLSIAKRAIQLHHGSISAENAMPGLRVKIVLPLAPEHVPQ